MRLLVGIALLAAVTACTTLDRTPVPLAELTKDTPPAIPNIPNARYWGDTAPPHLKEYLIETDRQRQAAGLVGDTTAIALSGGGDDGAFGAGIMQAWTELGTRPEFITVTGVSTGALSAPFIFLGSDYDDTLAILYGGLQPDDYYTSRSALGVLRNVSVEDPAGLRNLLEKYADEEMLARVAAEHRRGRRLLIQSSDLDAQRPMIWDLGAIAASGAPNALDVFRDALLASASIPVAFPPVEVEVEVDGKRYQELHADGGVISEDTTLARWDYDIRKDLGEIGQDGAPGTMYVIRNGRVEPKPAVTPYSLLGIAGRAVSTLIWSQGVADIVVGYEGAKLLGADFQVTWIGQDFQHPPAEPFDPGYMRALRKYGYDLMMAGKAWETKPLLLMSDEERASSPRTGRPASQPGT